MRYLMALDPQRGSKTPLGPPGGPFWTPSRGVQNPRFVLGFAMSSLRPLMYLVYWPPPPIIPLPLVTDHRKTPTKEGSGPQNPENTPSAMVFYVSRSPKDKTERVCPFRCPRGDRSVLDPGSPKLHFSIPSEKIATVKISKHDFGNWHFWHFKKWISPKS